MSFLKRRNRMVIFRVTEDEYENLKSVCSDRGARNLSDFARSELLDSIHRASPQNPLVHIDQKLNALETVIRRLAQILERKS